MKSRGFTLVELTVALALVGLMGLWLVRFFGAQQRGFGRQARVTLATQNVRGAAELLLSEAQNAGFDPRATAGARVTLATRDSLSWTADLNADGDATDSGPEGDENVLYFFDHDRGVLLRRGTSVEAVVVDRVDTLVFRYYDRFGHPTTRADRVARLELFLTFTESAGELRASMLTGTRLPNLEAR